MGRVKIAYVRACPGNVFLGRSGPIVGDWGKRWIHVRLKATSAEPETLAVLKKIWCDITEAEPE